GLAMLERNIERISFLARSLLGFSKGEAPEVLLVDPVELVTEIVDLYSDATEKDKIDIRLHAPAPIAPIAIDKEKMHSCLANLVSNAIDACQMSDKTECSVTVRCYEKDEAVVFEVEDEGCGMDYEIKKKAFTTFFTTKGKGGTGLGLLLTRKIVQEHGGKITCDSTPNEGTVFKLVFPRKQLPIPAGKDTINNDHHSDPERRMK
ncbi:MAG: HAMP domain-containing sensor histidine kinase, partial [Planctomycetota bacterium]